MIVPGHSKPSWSEGSSAAPAFEIAGECSLTILTMLSKSLAMTAGEGEVEDAEEDYYESEEEKVIVQDVVVVAAVSVWVRGVGEAGWEGCGC